MISSASGAHWVEDMASSASGSSMGISNEEASWYFFGCTRSHSKMCQHQKCNGCSAFPMLLAGKSSILESLIDSNTLLDVAFIPSGTKYIQLTIEQAAPSRRQRLFEYFAPSFVDLSLDTYGNYVVQQFIETQPKLGTDDEIDKIFDRLAPSLVALMKNPYGSRVVQRVIESSEWKVVDRILEEVAPDLPELCFDTYGNYVVQTILKNLNPAQVYPFVKHFAGNACWLAQHVHACRVLQILIRQYALESDIVDGLMRELARHVCDLSAHEHGNYVIQCLLEILPNDCELRYRIVCGLRDNLQLLSKNKFSSHVIEQVLINGSEDDRSFLVGAFCTLPPAAMRRIMTHRFGRFVANRIAVVSSEKCVERIITRVKSEGFPCRWLACKSEFVTKKSKHNNARKAVSRLLLTPGPTF